MVLANVKTNFSENQDRVLKWLDGCRDKILASLAHCYRSALRIGEFPCRLLRTKNHHFASAPFPWFSANALYTIDLFRWLQILWIAANYWFKERGKCAWWKL